MNSPTTGKRMTLKKEIREHTYRKETFSYIFWYYLCEDTQERFTTNGLDDAIINQVYNQYRQKYNVPFPDEIKDIRKQYGLSARRMGVILGFELDIYRNYEQGEVPSLDDAKLIRFAANPIDFFELVKINSSLNKKSMVKITKRIEELVNNPTSLPLLDFKTSLLKFYETPCLNTGYRKLSLPILTFVVKHFAEKLQPYKTQMNKLLFYCDFMMFKRSCYSITGLAYKPSNMGPVPKDYEILYSYLKETNKIKIETTAFDNGALREQFLPANNDRVLNILSKQQKNVIREVEERFRKFSTKELIDHSHKEIAWLENYKTQNLISYQYAFDMKL